MSDALSLVNVLAGAVLGGVVAWLFLRSNIQHAADRVNAVAQAERAILSERLRGLDQQLNELKSRLAQQNSELESVRNELKMETDKRATAEQKNSQIPKLAAAFTEKESQLAQLQNLPANLRSQLAETVTQLQAERKAAAEKLALLNEALLKLCDAFKALSADALKHNNQSFLVLAQATLRQFQQVAKGDLEKCQQAIDEMVKPVRVLLEKFDVKTQDLQKARVGAYEGLNQQVKSLLETQVQLRSNCAPRQPIW